MNLHEDIERIKEVMGLKKTPKRSFDKSKLAYYEYMMEMIEEDSKLDDNDEDIRRDILNKIKNDEFVNDVDEFYDSIRKSTRPEMLTLYEKHDLGNMKLYKVDGYDAGYALKQQDEDGDYNEIVSVFNNSGVKGIGSELVNSAIRNGGCYLDHYDDFLSGFYENLGFVEIDRLKFDPQYDPESEFRNKYGELDIVYRKHKSCF
jgi:hypothetical protein